MENNIELARILNEQCPNVEAVARVQESVKVESNNDLSVLLHYCLNYGKILGIRQERARRRRA